MSPTPNPAPNPTLEALTAEVTRVTTVMGSATTLISGIASRIQTAIDKAQNGGASAEQLAPINAEVATLRAGADALVEAVAANTPADPTPNDPAADPPTEFEVNPAGQRSGHGSRTSGRTDGR